MEQNKTSETTYLITLQLANHMQKWLAVSYNKDCNRLFIYKVSDLQCELKVGDWQSYHKVNNWQSSHKLIDHQSYYKGSDR